MLDKDGRGVVERSYAAIPAESRLRQRGGECSKWLGLAECFVKFESTTDAGTETRYFISNRMLTSKQAGELARSHWHVENKLHLTLDRCLGEDACRSSGFGMARAWIHALAHNWLRFNRPQGGWEIQKMINAGCLSLLFSRKSWAWI